MNVHEKWKRVNESPVPSGLDPQPLLSYLTGRFSYLDETEWGSEITSGSVMVNGRACSRETIVSAGDLVAWMGR